MIPRATLFALAAPAALALSAALCGCGGSGSSGSGGAPGAGGNGGSGASGGALFPEDPGCTPGSFGISGRIHGAAIETRLYPLSSPSVTDHSLTSDFGSGGRIDITWQAPTVPPLDQGDSASGTLTIPGDTGKASVWCVDPTTRLVQTGTAARLALELSQGACPQGTDPRPALIDMIGCFDTAP